METEGERMNKKFKYYNEKLNFGRDVAFVVREKLEHVIAWLLHITEYLDLHHAYTNNCTMFRYNDIQICGKPPYLWDYSTKKGTVMACFTFLKMAEKNRNL
jgi:hypothetical protein